MKQLKYFAVLALTLAVGCGGSDSKNDSTSNNDPATNPSPSPSKPMLEANTDAPAEAQQKALIRPVTGTVDGVNFSGLLHVTKFIANNDQILAVGNITDVTGVGDVAINALQGNTFQFPVSFPQQASAPSGDAASAQASLASCDILFLQLAPLDLNLLGLTVHLDQVTLDINGETGSNALLGNLLCAITGLLDPVGFLQNILQIVDLLNQVIGLIGEL